MRAQKNKISFKDGNKKFFKTVTGLQVMVSSAEELVGILRTDSESLSSRVYDSDAHFMNCVSDTLLFQKHLVVRTDDATSFVTSLIKHDLVREFSTN
jgi:hypothetical protein